MCDNASYISDLHYKENRNASRELLNGFAFLQYLMLYNLKQTTHYVYQHYHTFKKVR